MVLSNLNEMWVIPGGDEKHYVEDVEIYTSGELKTKYIEAISDYPLTKPIKDKIAKMVKNGYIIPAWFSKNILYTIILDIFGSPMTRSILGFYSPSYNVVVILLNNNKIFLFYVPNKKLSKITLHELMHFCAANYPEKFRNNCYEILSKYYTSLFSNYFGLEEKTVRSGSIKFFTSLLKSEGRKHIIWEKKEFKKVLENSFEYIYKKDKKVNEKIKDLIRFVGKFYDDPNKILASPLLYRDMLKPLYVAYESIGIESPGTFAVQEYWCASEVICVVSEFADKFNFIYKNL